MVSGLAAREEDRTGSASICRSNCAKQFQDCQSSVVYISDLSISVRLVDPIT